MSKGNLLYLPNTAFCGKIQLCDCEVALFIFPVKKSLSKVCLGREKNGLKTNVSQGISKLLKKKKNLGQHVKNEHFQYNLSPMHKSC